MSEIIYSDKAMDLIDDYIALGYRHFVPRIGKIRFGTVRFYDPITLDFVFITPDARVVNCTALSVSDWERARFGIRETPARHKICTLLTDLTMKYLDRH